MHSVPYSTRVTDMKEKQHFRKTEIQKAELIFFNTKNESTFVKLIENCQVTLTVAIDMKPEYNDATHARLIETVG